MYKLTSKKNKNLHIDIYICSHHEGWHVHFHSIQNRYISRVFDIFHIHIVAGVWYQFHHLQCFEAAAKRRNKTNDERKYKWQMGKIGVRVTSYMSKWVDPQHFLSKKLKTFNRQLMCQIWVSDMSKYYFNNNLVFELNALRDFM